MIQTLLSTDANGKGSINVLRLTSIEQSHKFADSFIQLQKYLKLEKAFYVLVDDSKDGKASWKIPDHFRERMGKWRNKDTFTPKSYEGTHFVIYFIVIKELSPIFRFIIPPMFVGRGEQGKDG